MPRDATSRGRAKSLAASPHWRWRCAFVVDYPSLELIATFPSPSVDETLVRHLSTLFHTCCANNERRISAITVVEVYTRDLTRSSIDVDVAQREFSAAAAAHRGTTSYTTPGKTPGPLRIHAEFVAPPPGAEPEVGYSFVTPATRSDTIPAIRLVRYVLTLPGLPELDEQGPDLPYGRQLRTELRNLLGKLKLHGQLILEVLDEAERKGPYDVVLGALRNGLQQFREYVQKSPAIAGERIPLSAAFPRDLGVLRAWATFRPHGRLCLWLLGPAGIRAGLTGDPPSPAVLSVVHGTKLPTGLLCMQDRRGSAPGTLEPLIEKLAQSLAGGGTSRGEVTLEAGEWSVAWMSVAFLREMCHHQKVVTPKGGSLQPTDQRTGQESEPERWDLARSAFQEAERDRRLYSEILLASVAESRQVLLAGIQRYLDSVTDLEGEWLVAAGKVIERLCEQNHCVLQRVDRNRKGIAGSEFTLRCSAESICAVPLDKRAMVKPITSVSGLHAVAAELLPVNQQVAFHRQVIGSMGRLQDAGESRQLSTPEAAAFLGIDATLVQRYARQGRLGKRLGGKQFMFTLSELEAFKATPRPIGKHR